MDLDEKKSGISVQSDAHPRSGDLRLWLSSNG